MAAIPGLSNSLSTVAPANERGAGVKNVTADQFRGQALGIMKDLLKGVATPGKIGITFDEKGGYKINVETGLDSLADRQLQSEVQTLFNRSTALRGVLAGLSDAIANPRVPPPLDPRNPDKAQPADAAATPPGDLGLYLTNEFGDSVEISESGYDNYTVNQKEGAGIVGGIAYTGGAVAAQEAAAAEMAAAEALRIPENKFAGTAPAALNVILPSMETPEDRLVESSKIWSKTDFVHRLAGNADKEFMLGRATNQQKETSELIRVALKDAGIKLKSDERFSLTLKADGSFAVEGLKDRGKARRIENALKDNTELASALRRQKVYGDAALGLRIDAGNEKGESYNLTAATRYGLMADYLQREFDVNLDELEISGEGGDGQMSIAGVEGKLATALNGDTELALALTSVLETRPEEGYPESEVTMEFANGMVADESLTEAARQTAEQMHTAVQTRMADYNDVLFKSIFGNGASPGAMDKDKLEEYLIQKFNPGSIEIVLDSDGGLSYSGRMGKEKPGFDGEPAGAQGLLETWMEDFMSSGLTTALFEQALVRHQVEYGDTDDFQHSAALTITEEGADLNVLSPAADAEIMATAREAAAEIGESLGAALKEKGVTGDPEFGVGLTEDGRLVAEGIEAAPGGGQPAAAALDELLGAANNINGLKEKTEDAAGRAPQADKERRRDGFMEPFEPKYGAEEAEARRAADKERGKYAETEDGYAIAAWLESTSNVGAMPDVNDVAQVTRTEADLKEEAGDGGVAAGGKSTSGAARRALAGDDSENGFKKRLDTGLAEFSGVMDDGRKELEAATARLRMNPADPKSLAEAAASLNEWMLMLHDPDLYGTLKIT